VVDMTNKKYSLNELLNQCPSDSLALDDEDREWLDGQVNTMNYKGYTARIEFDGRENIFTGRVLGVRDIISFHGETVAELHNEFETAIDDYLLDCNISPACNTWSDFFQSTDKVTDDFMTKRKDVISDEGRFNFEDWTQPENESK